MEIARASTTTSSWSHQPDHDRIGVSIFSNHDRFSIRFHVRLFHLNKIKNPKALGIRGSALNGFILTPDNKAGIKPSRVAGSDLFYLMQTISKFDLSKRLRRTVWMRAEYADGHIRIPPLPPAWISADPEFDPGNGGYEEGTRTMAVSRNGKDDPVRVGSGESQPIASRASTIPPPKPSPPQYQLPHDSTLASLQIELGQKLEEAQIIVQEMERLSGLRLVLDRNLRLVVNLAPPLK